MNSYVFHAKALGALLAMFAGGSFAGGLKDLNVQATGGTALAPSFNTDTFRYQVDVQSDIELIDINAQASNPAHKVAIYVNGKPTMPSNAKRVQLGVGGNGVEVLVTDASGRAVDSYRLDIWREDIMPVVNTFLKKTFNDTATGRTMPYRLFVPEGFDPNKKYPLVVFLHGGGERGDDNEKPLTANQGGTIWAKPSEQAKRAAFVLVPQARMAWDGGFGRTRNPQNVVNFDRAFVPSDDMHTAHRLLQQVLLDYPAIDAKRLYSTGLSQGGLGTWAWNIVHPGLFAAMVPVCGGAEPAQVAVLKGKPIWAFHAASDPVVPVDFTRKAVGGLSAAGIAHQYTEYAPDTFFAPNAHFSWVPAYKNEAMREWLFKQSL